MLPLDEVRKINQELADKIHREARSNPQSPYAGKVVGIANGQVVLVGDDEDEIDAGLDAVEPEPLRTIIVDTNYDPDKIEYIWGAI